MHKNGDIKEKLEPLRRFCVPGLYSVRYLSILVQRKRLKAKKIGRNYFTCEAWFEKYLRIFAAEEKREIYFNYLAQQTQKYADVSKKIKGTRLEKLTLSELDYIKDGSTSLNLREGSQAGQKVNFFVFNKFINIKTVAATAAIFILFVSVAFFVPWVLDHQGQVAGESEKTENAATSTQAIFIKGN